MMGNRFLQLVLPVFLVITADARYIRRNRSHLDWSNSLPSLSSAVKSVAVIHPYPWCFEVLYGVTYNMQQLVAEVDLYIGDWTPQAFPDVSWHGSGPYAFMKGYFGGEVRRYASLDSFQDQYQVLIWTDHWGMHYAGLEDPGLRATLDRGYQGQIWVYSHEPEWLLWPLLCNCSEGHQHTSNPDFQHNTVEVLSHVQVTFFTIAPHVAKLLQQLLLQVGITKQIQWAMPVFPALDMSRSRSHVSRPSRHGKRGFAIQGRVDPFRRNHTGLFEDVATSQELANSTDFELLMFARNMPDSDIIPAALKETVVHRSFADEAFYKELNKALAILTVFPGDRYYKQAASSTVATAISAGVPLVVNAPFLRVYNFVLPGAVVVANDSSHAIALQQILGMAAQEWEELALEMALVREVTLLRNFQVFSAQFESAARM